MFSEKKQNLNINDRMISEKSPDIKQNISKYPWVKQNLSE